MNIKRVEISMDDGAHDDLYGAYAKRKGWIGARTSDDESYFDYLARLAGVRNAGRLLEIGFGDGVLLDWAKSRGHDVVGVEILPDVIERAKRRGHIALLGPLKADMFPPSSFDYIFAMDVFEHLSTRELLDLLKIFRILLRQNGLIIARFPNGKSPFFGHYQFSDITHRSCLSPDSLDQLAERAGLRVTSSLLMRPFPRGVFAKLRRWLVYRIRSLLEIVVGLAYFGKRTALDPNAVVVLAVIVHD